MSSTGITILDTGPSLNFFSIGKANLLLDTLHSVTASLAMPADVVQEIRDKTNEDERFRGSDRALDWALRNGHIAELDSRSGVDPDVDKFVSAILGMPHERQATRAKDIGERMVVAHAMALRNRGERVLVLIDDGGGQLLAQKYGFKPVTTLHVLRRAARLGLIADWSEMREIYLRLRPEPGSSQPPKDHGLLSLTDPEVQRALRDKGIYGRGSGTT